MTPMPSLTPQQASARVDCYLHRAQRAFQDHEQATKRFGEDASYSVLHLGLKAILGRELTGLLWRAGEPIQRYEYPMEADERSIDDHVIPLGEIISLLAATPSLVEELARFRAFMVQHIVMAKIPKWLDDKLNAHGWRSVMPTPQWKNLDLGSEEKLDAVWARYAAIGVIRPGRPGSPFTDYQP